MLVRVPTIPTRIAPLQSLPPPLVEIIDRVSAFIASGNVTVLTGAGVSVDSNIPSYRGASGRYLNPNFKPILYHELAADTPAGFSFRSLKRQRYWLRSYLGYKSISSAQPNAIHLGLAALQYAGYIPRIITQNVDGLHHKALDVSPAPPDIDRALDSILELHGSLHSVHCSRGHVIDRQLFQELLGDANPSWKEFLEGTDRSGIRANPDGDADIGGLSYDQFIIPNCAECLLEGHQNCNLKPEVIFFGESIGNAVKERSFHDVELCDSLLIIGTTLATFSAFRLLKHALALKKPVLMLNIGPSRADDLDHVEKIEIPAGSVIPQVTKAILLGSYNHNPVLNTLLQRLTVAHR